MDSRNLLNAGPDSKSKPDVSPGGEKSLDRVLESIPLGKFHYRLLIICGMSFMADAMEVSLLSFISTCAGKSWDLSDSQIALIASVVFVGVLIGNLFWGPFADKYGRRWAFILGSGMIILAGFLSGAAPNYPSLLVFRTLCGFGVGGSTIPFDLLAEFLPNSHRGRFLIYIEYFWTLGSMFVAGVAWVLLSSSGWRVLTYVTAIPVAVSLVGSVFVLPESPRWLLVQGRREEAEAIIKSAAAFNGTELEEFTLAPLEEKVEDVSMLEFFKPGRINLSIPLWTVWLCFGFTYYGTVLFITRRFDHNSEDDDGDDDDDTCAFNYQEIFVSAASEAIGVLLAAAVIDRWGRVPAQSVGYGVCAVFVLLLGVKMPHAALSVFGIFARCAVMGASCATWVATPELFPTELRATGHSVASSVSRIGAFSAPFLVDSDATVFSVGVCLSVMCAVATAAALFLPETLGKDLDKVTKVRSTSFDKNVHNIMHSVERSVSKESKKSVDIDMSP
eukprot:CAMPEP_0185036990 /NCGR_PEP_ID=MMETSP1103-20130426/30801_1 /TAXON_ID=36769 /ORGANISM="Paraphysomonas bandaiensis, Strain Caron Lab Isolate" /LENGTH=502 /DNA_ID=CAMNT_0027574779 /DNA_START=122 /DNA_END=1630 /DNA_ORIENTATION=+